MTRLALPSGTAVAGVTTGLTTDVNNIAKYLALHRSRGIFLDEYSDSGDDAKLAAAMTDAAAATHPPPILLTSGRTYNFTQAITPYDGFKLCGPLAGSTMNTELSDDNMPCRVNLSGIGGPWCNNTAETYDGFVGGGIGFVGDSSTGAFGGGGLYHQWGWRDLSFHQIKYVLGSQTTKMLMTTCHIDGFWASQGTYNGGYHIGGSDNDLWTNNALVDSSAAYMTAGGATGQYHFWFDGLDNSSLGRLYVSLQGDWCAVRVTGSAYNASGPPSNLGRLNMYAPVLEGTNAGSNTSTGCVMRVEGGVVVISGGGYSGRCMTSPSNNGHSPADAGAYHVTGGALFMDAMMFDHATSVAESSPFVYNNGGLIDIRRTLVGSKGGVWTGLPRVQNVSGTAYVDESVTPVKTGGTMRQYQAVAL